MRRALALALLAAGCAGTPAGSPAPPAATAPPELIALRHFFASREANWGYRVSPDGTRLGWVASHGGRSTVHFRTLGADDARPIDTHSRRTVYSFTWAADSRRILYLHDTGGDENYHVYLTSIERPDAPPVDLTPVAGSRAWIHRVIRSDPSQVIVAWNGRDRAVFDLYRVNLDTRERTLIAENSGDVIEWLTDWEGRPRARIRHVGPDERRLEVLRDGGWVMLQRFDLEEFNVQMLGLTPDDRGLWLLSSRGRDRLSLVRVDIATGTESLVYEDPKLDLEWAIMSERTRAPLAVVTYPGRQAIHVFDPSLETDLQLLRRDSPTGFHILSFDADERYVTVEVFTEKGYENYLVDRRTKEKRFLGRSQMVRFADALATTEPIAVTARDGVRLHGYLTRPPGYVAPGPMVLVVHGGHWARDYWGFSSVVQVLANRGYAVLQVNYRGSTGYGRAFRELAIGEYAGKMHDDLIDAVRWAVAGGIADAARVAIYGGSYGGYASLVGMTFTPEVFACGVAIVGISNLLSFYEAVPPYWQATYVPLFHRYVGDPSRPEDRRRLEEKSPLFKAHQVQRPLLIIHGARDSRVNVRESEQMVAALRQAGKDVRYVVFPDEGHRRTYGNWRNALRHYGEVEDFLARCLGGRKS
ncbi:MAG: S9 family peptidase [Candidatus Rokubacteria bacterium]|nr:S9 family peptidase [Candidatus Rokubacteria bacterium]